MSDLASVPGDAGFAQFQFLRVRVERELRKDSVIMVTSAAPRDGKSLTAHGLAHALAQAGHRTAIVDATQKPAGTFRAPSSTKGLDGEIPIPIVMPSVAAGRVRKIAAEFVRSARAEYDYVVIDCEPLLSDPLALALADSVDAVLVSVCVGRAPLRDDKATIAMIEHYDARLLGIVAVTPDAIAGYHESRSALPEPKRERAPRALPTPARRSS